VKSRPNVSPVLEHAVTDDTASNPTDGGGETSCRRTDDNHAAQDSVTMPSSKNNGRPRHRVAAAAIGLIIITLGALTGWLGWQAKSLRDNANEDAAFVQAASKAAVNLTTVDWEHADKDVERILNSATGAFYDDFSRRSKPFLEIVTKVKSKSKGNVTAAGLEDASLDSGRVLVAVSVTTTTATAPQEQLRAWRLRVSVTKVDDDVKVSNVEFVA